MHVSTFYCIHSTFRQYCSCETRTTLLIFCLFLIRSILLILFSFSLYQLVLSFGSELHLILVLIFLASPHNNALLESELGKFLQLLGLGLVHRFGSIF